MNVVHIMLCQSADGHAFFHALGILHEAETNGGVVRLNLLHAPIRTVQ